VAGHFAAICYIRGSAELWITPNAVDSDCSPGLLKFVWLRTDTRLQARLPFREQSFFATAGNPSPVPEYNHHAGSALRHSHTST